VGLALFVWFSGFFYCGCFCWDGVFPGCLPWWAGCVVVLVGILIGVCLVLLWVLLIFCACRGVWVCFVFTGGAFLC